MLNDIPVHDYVAATSVGIIDSTRMLDLAYEEDSRAEVDMNVVMTGRRKIHRSSRARPKPCRSGASALDELLDLAQGGPGPSIALQKQAVGHYFEVGRKSKVGSR